ncbi:MAG: putative S-adenosylmethionine-dependent methyltransferase [Candidatus Berkelbacteria bacterium]|nr:putative S-adenosylmethionine-dependent methyltransferase [Candidatus Berkelbacteria bacterium]
MQDGSAQRLFQGQIKYYSRRDQSAGISPIIPLFLEWAKKRQFKSKINIAEFGGSSGLLLSKILAKYPRANFFNIELIKDYNQEQINKKIQFIEGSVLKPPFKDRYFDCIIIRDVLHHLVGKNLTETKYNQIKALKEIRRILKFNGLVLVEELTNNSKIASSIIYYISKINSRIGLNIKSLQITTNTVISLLTPEELILIVQKIFGHEKIIKKSYLPSKNNRNIRLVHLGTKSGKIILAIKK